MRKLVDFDMRTPLPQVGRLQRMAPAPRQVPATVNVPKPMTSVQDIVRRMVRDERAARIRRGGFNSLEDYL